MRQLLSRSSAVVAAAIVAAAPAAFAPAAHAEETAPDLTVSTLPAASPAPGEVYDRTVTVTNRGTAPADGVTFRVRLTRGLDFPEQVAGCAYSTVGDQVRQALCELDTVLEPGATLTAPVRFKALPNALMEAVEYGTGATGEAPGEGFDDANRRLTLTADSSADLVAVGDDTEALAGDRQSINVGLRNDGPGWIQNQDSDDLPGLLVTIPPGTRASEVPDACSPFDVDGPSGPPVPGKPRYVCWPEDGTLDVGESHTYTFMLDIDEDAKTTEGEVRASSVYGTTPEYDRDLANNTAVIRVAIPTDYEPEPTPSPSGSSTPGDPGDGGNDPEGQAAGGTGSSGTSGSTGTTGTTGSSTTGGNLAATGSDGAPLLAGAAGAAAALGALLVLAVRRFRRSS
ncbi:hypothetical protein [Streptomyces sp. NPDC048002]|uniref:hypothetical protein n=1 Tax=Streptomyces sp. NPDC048002 TaxID=3154344 RepID=UPI0033EC38BB